MIRGGTAKKGDVLGVARIAGIMAAKRTAELIPLCHPLPITAVTLELTAGRRDAVEIAATVRTTGQTGVEMEALTAASRRRADGLRHVQGGRSRHADRGAAAGAQGRRQVGGVRAGVDGVFQASLTPGCVARRSCAGGHVSAFRSGGRSAIVRDTICGRRRCQKIRKPWHCTPAGGAIRPPTLSRCRFIRPHPISSTAPNMPPTCSP